MSHITFKGPTEAKSFVLSLWFRVPKESMDKARQEYTEFLTAQDGSDVALQTPPLCGVVPLMVFGPKKNRLMSSERFTSDKNQVSSEVFHHWDGMPTCAWIAEAPTEQTSNFSDWRTKDTHFTVDPSYIGVDCRSKKNILTYNLWYASNADTEEADDKPDIENVWMEMDGGYTEPDPLLVYGTPQASFPVDCSNRPETIFDSNGIENPAPYYTANFISVYGNDKSLVYLGLVPEALAAVPLDGYWVVNFQGSMGTGFAAPDDYEAGMEVAADHWHHLLMSVENNLISTKGTIGDHGGDLDLFKLESGTVKSTVKVFIALDDKNLTGKQLSYFANSKNTDINQVMTPNAYVVFNTFHDTYSDNPMPYDSGQGYMVQIDRQGFDQAIYEFDPPPFPIGDIQMPGDDITTKHVEMAELQMFINTHLDTSVIDNRRAFVSDEGKPVSVSKAEELMLKKPEILFHSAANWKIAMNRGSLAQNPPQEGEHVGEIKTYHPNPSLHGPQNPE